MLGESFISKELPRSGGAGTTQQLLTLLWRKEVTLKCRRPITSVCEVLLPVVLCGLILLSRLAKDLQVDMGNITYVQDSFLGAASTLSPFAFDVAWYASRARADDLQSVVKHFESKNISNITGVPNAIWPLAMYLEYASLQALPPFDGTFLAVAPDVPAVHAMLNSSLRWPVEYTNANRPIGPSKALRVRLFDNEAALVKATIGGASVYRRRSSSNPILFPLSPTDRLMQ